MRGVADHERHRAKGLYLWSRTRGLRLVAGPGVGAEQRPIPNREDALSVIEYIEEAEQGLYVLSDFAPYLLEYGAPKPELIRRLRELAWAIRSRPVTVIFLGARFPEIPELEKEVKVLDLPLRLAALTFTPEARAFGVEEAKGLLLVGLPGCGKDTIARAASSVLGRALLQLDLGALMGEGGGLLGSAELSIKRALQIATTAKCVLHLSEYEKPVGVMQSSARTDGGATSRVVGSLLSWLAEPHPGVFVIATANDVRELAPEQVREGRFTPVFVDLPTRKDRADIFRVHLA